MEGASTRTYIFEPGSWPEKLQGCARGLGPSTAEPRPVPAWGCFRPQESAASPLGRSPSARAADQRGCHPGLQELSAAKQEGATPLDALKGRLPSAGRNWAPPGSFSVKTRPGAT